LQVTNDCWSMPLLLTTLCLHETRVGKSWGETYVPSDKVNYDNFIQNMTKFDTAKPARTRNVDLRPNQISFTSTNSETFSYSFPHAHETCNTSWLGVEVLSKDIYWPLARQWYIAWTHPPPTVVNLFLPSRKWKDYLQIGQPCIVHWQKN
jgi:hypothetical protein